MKKAISTDKAPAAIGPYSQAIEVNGMVYTSGVIPVVPSTGEIPEGAAAQADHLLRILLLGVGQGAQVAEHPVLRVLPDGAGVDDDAVRAFFGVDDVIAARAEHTADPLGIRLVLLAAIGVDVGPRRPAARGPPGFDLAADRRLSGQLLLRDHNGFAFHVHILRTAYTE